MSALNGKPQAIAIALLSVLSGIAATLVARLDLLVGGFGGPYFLIVQAALPLHTRRYLASASGAALFGADSVLLPQTFPARVTFFQSWYIQNYRGTGLPARASELPTVW